MSAHFDRALVLFEQSRHDLAEQELRQALAADPDHAFAHALLALCLSERKQYQEATEEAKTAIHLAPDVPFAHYALASTLAARDRLQEAADVIREAIRLNPEDADYFALLAAIRFEQRRWSETLEAADQGLQLDPEHVTCNNMRAMALVKLGRKQEAGATITTALAKDPDDALSHANQGWTLLEQGNPTQALTHFREALRLEPGLEWARAGIVEALKARNLLYRLFLWYFLWMAKLSRRAQWGLLIGGYIGYRLLDNLAADHPALAPWVWPVLVAYLIFAWMTWLAVPLFNLLLRLDRFGRLALSREEIVAANWVGGWLLAALLCLGLGWLADSALLRLSGISLGLLALPLAVIFNCSAGWPRRAMAAYTGLLVVAVVGSYGLYVAGHPAASRFFLSAFFLGVALSTWVGNILAMTRPAR
jgi:tetratricopeptide (TPR) repeat protein